MSARSRGGASGGVSALAFGVALLCLGCSLFQSASFLSRLATDDGQMLLLVAISAGIILGSAVLAHMVGAMVAVSAAGGLIFLALVVIVACEAYSVATSASNLSASLYDSEDRERQASPEWQMAHRTAELYTRQAESLSARADELPMGYSTRAASIQGEASAALRQAQQAQAYAAALEVSSTAKALEGIEGATGLTRSQIVMLCSVLLSLLPVTLFLCRGALFDAGPTRREGKPGKHNRQPGGE